MALALHSLVKITDNFIDFKSKLSMINCLLNQGKSNCVRRAELESPWRIQQVVLQAWKFRLFGSFWVLMNVLRSFSILLNTSRSFWDLFGILLGPYEHFSSFWILLDTIEYSKVVLNPLRSFWILMSSVSWFILCRQSFWKMKLPFNNSLCDLSIQSYFHKKSLIFYRLF